ncbi:T9SS type A sorting domain-containing protein [Dyadobacter sp. CY345]|uniref:T9SS type A sorting domain-containing protein n=1 Tax=Dyadobacter sp. CY345 TaxID=2909335 RepID=UPI001F3D4DF0|nr:T9SS type A sorting domain-containing protein [Dyadobacter sp. CY345]MCF2443289.1 T9SS type A sorting domain-containing protein [Dyadobacter sp. CY345]
MRGLTSIRIVVSLACLFAFATHSIAQQRPYPAGVSSGLNSWWEAKAFNETANVWYPNFGNVALLPFLFTPGRSSFKKTDAYNGLNFNPVLKMTTAGMSAGLVLTNDPSASYTVIAVSRPGSYTAPFNRLWGFGENAAHPGFSQYTRYGSTARFSAAYILNSENNVDWYSTSQDQPREFNISGASFSYGEANRYLEKIISLDGQRKTVHGGERADFSTMNLYLNADPAATFTQQETDYAELIIYRRLLTETELSRLHTYLSIKYSIPLRIDVPSSVKYTMDGVTDLWTSTAGFNYHITGIGRHSSSGLDQRLSLQTRGGFLPVSTLGGGSSAAVPFLNDNTYFLVGDNDKPLEPTVQLPLPGGTRPERIFRAQNTGVTDSLWLGVAPNRFPAETPCNSNYLVISNTPAFETYSSVKLRPDVINSPTSFSRYAVHAVFPQGESYFTFATLEHQVTPVVTDGDVESQTFSNCKETDGLNYFLDELGKPIFSISGLSETQLNALTVRIKKQTGPVQFDNSSFRSALMGRLLTLNLNAPATFNATIRFYYQPGELDATRIAGGTDFWFKKEATTQQILDDFTPDGTLTPGSYAQLAGTAGIQNGISYIEFPNLTSFSTIGFISSKSVALPVRLLDFDVTKEKNVSMLTWVTSQEVNAERFDIQRSADAKSWETIGHKAATGESDDKVYYQFTDYQPLPRDNYYRLKMIDHDGTFALSRLNYIAFDSDNTLILYPNPGTDVVKIKKGIFKPGTMADISIFDTLGKKVFSFSGATDSEFNISSLPTGIYQMVVTTKTGDVRRSKISVMR